MLLFVTKKILYGILVLIGVVMLVFFLFQGFGDPARLVMGETGDAKTLNNIRHELNLDQPKWKQFLFYLNDVSPVSFYSSRDIASKNIKGLKIGGETKMVLKLPYLRTSYQTKKSVGLILMEALPGTFILAFTAMFIAILIGIPLGVLASTHKNKWMDSVAVFTSVVGISAPSFFMGIIIAYVFGFVFNGLYRIAYYRQLV